jgi:hypothetical protein
MRPKRTDYALGSILKVKREEFIGGLTGQLMQLSLNIPHPEHTSPPHGAAIRKFLKHVVFSISRTFGEFLMRGTGSHRGLLPWNGGLIESL